MNLCVGNLILRRPEKKDIKHLHRYKNDREIAAMLAGFSMGYSITDLVDWIEAHRQRKDELLWVIEEKESQQCIGHVGLYNIDYRIRSAEFGILIGERSLWGKGLGRTCTKLVLEYGFNELNLNRIYLSVISTNKRAIRLYRSLGFVEEGCLRKAQFKGGRYLDVLVMALLKDEYCT